MHILRRCSLKQLRSSQSCNTILFVIFVLPGSTIPTTQEKRVIGGNIVEITNSRNFVIGHVIHIFIAIARVEEAAQQDQAEENARYHSQKGFFQGRNTVEKGRHQKDHCWERKEVGAQQHFTAIGLDNKEGKWCEGQQNNRRISI